MGLVQAARCTTSYLRETMSPTCREGEATDFESWVVSRFGRRLFEMFFKSYSEKLWGIPCGDLDADFAAQADATWRADWRFLVTGDWQRSADLKHPFRGLALPPSVVDKIYRHNAQRVYPQAWRYDRTKTEGTR